MRFDFSTAAWWGAPKRFDNQPDERRVSWLELFYDLVYVIAIARITHVFAHHLGWAGFVQYSLLFMLIYWGWLNGSMYTDLHGSRGLRTRLMTLWQMMIIAAFAILFDQSNGTDYRDMTIVFMIMQLYITYIWWSVGFYDKSHRRYNMPYTILYLLSLAWMALSLFTPVSWLVFIVPVILICNYVPPFFADRLLRRDDRSLDLSVIMFERLGLFTIIVFGEVVLGLVNGIGGHYKPRFITWLNFGLAMSVIFLLWWLFSVFVSRRKPKKGFTRASLLELMYIPALLSLGLIAASLSVMFNDDGHSRIVFKTIGFGLGLFMICIDVMNSLLESPSFYHLISRRIRVSLLVTGMIFIVSAFIPLDISITFYLGAVLLILCAEVLYTNSIYYALHIEEKLYPGEPGGPE